MGRCRYKFKNHRRHFGPPSEWDWERIRPRRFPRRSDRGKIMGVCAGLAEHFDLSTKGVRIVAVILLIFSGFWPMIGIYFLVGLLMRPPIPGRRPDKVEVRVEQTFYQEGPTRDRDEDRVRRDFAAERRRAGEALKTKFDKLNRRLQDMEDKVTAKEFDWERRYNES